LSRTSRLVSRLDFLGQQVTREFAAVIGNQEAQRTALYYQTVQYRHNVLRAQPFSDFDGERLTAKDAHDSQRSQTVAVGQLVRHEV
jgi:hypothetical protein